MTRNTTLLAELRVFRREYPATAALVVAGNADSRDRLLMFLIVRLGLTWADATRILGEPAEPLPAQNEGIPERQPTTAPTPTSPSAPEP